MFLPAPRPLPSKRVLVSPDISNDFPALIRCGTRRAPFHAGV